MDKFVESTATIIEREMEEAEFDFIWEVIKTHFLFQDLSKVMLKYLVESMKLLTYEEGSNVFKQGQPGSKFYIIAEGELEVIINSQKAALLVRGNSFGELALINDAYRSATIHCATGAQLWTLDR